MKRILISAAIILSSITMTAQEQQQRVLAHRAGRADFEENVLPSFKASYDAGMRSFETDVRITADGRYVISHDADMARMYGKPGIIEQTKLKDLKTYRSTKGNNEITTLDELLAFLNSKEDMYVEFELKTDPKAYPQELLEKYCDDVYKKVMKNKPASSLYILSSFDYRALRYLTTKHPDEDCFMLIHGDPVGDKTIALALSLGVKRMACTINGSSRKSLKEAHEKGIRINLWPGSGPDDFILAYQLGADYICTDYPVELIDFVKGKEGIFNVRF